MGALEPTQSPKKAHLDPDTRGIGFIYMENYCCYLFLFRYNNIIFVRIIRKRREPLQQ